MSTFWVSGEDEEKDPEEGREVEGKGRENEDTTELKDEAPSGQAWEIDFGSPNSSSKPKKMPKFLSRARAQPKEPQTMEANTSVGHTPPTLTPKAVTSSPGKKVGKSYSAKSSRKSTPAQVASYRTPPSAPSKVPRPMTSTRVSVPTKPASQSKALPYLSSSSSSSSSAPSRKERDSKTPASHKTRPSSAPSSVSKISPKTTIRSPRLSLSSPKALFTKRKHPDTTKSVEKTMPAVKELDSGDGRSGFVSKIAPRRSPVHAQGRGGRGRGMGRVRERGQEVLGAERSVTDRSLSSEGKYERKGGTREVVEGEGWSEVSTSGEERVLEYVDHPDGNGPVWQVDFTHPKLQKKQSSQTHPQEVITSISDREDNESGGGGRGVASERKGGRRGQQLPVVTISSKEEGETDRSRAVSCAEDMSSRKVLDLKRWYVSQRELSLALDISL